MSFGAIAGAAITIGGGLIMNNQKQKAAEGAANAQKSATRTAMNEEQRQYDLNMEEYQRKQSILEQQMQQTQQLMTPYIQSGQGALFEMLALSGVAVPAQPVVPQGFTPPQQSQSEQRSLLPQTEVDSQGVRQTMAPVGGPGVPGQQPTGGQFSAMESMSSPYAGMTGEQAQQAAIQKISDSPMLQELTRQGEQAILQNASATGGLRGGNVQGALAQYRPQMLKQAIDEQYARLGNLSSAGLSATGSLPYVSNVGSVPTSNASTYLSQMGDINAGRMLSQAENQANLYGDVAKGLGTAAGAYFNRNKPKPEPEK